MPVLVDGVSRKNAAEATGRTRCNRVVNFDAAGRDLRGRVVPMRIVRVLPHSLRGEIVSDRVPVDHVAPAREA
jgi:tRNA A37 methylthiotransferase MiaB